MELSHRNYASVFLNSAAVFILAGMIVNTSIYRQRGRKDDKIFFFMLLGDICLGLCDTVVALVNGRDFAGARLINTVAYTGIYLFTAVLAYLVPLYLLYRYTRREDIFKVAWRVLLVPLICIFAMYLIGVPNGYFLTVDEQNTYHFGKYYVVPLGMTLVYTLVSFVIPLIVKIKFGRLRHMYILLYLIPISGAVLPFVFDVAADAAIVFAVIFAYMHMSAMNEEFFDISEGVEVKK